MEELIERLQELNASKKKIDEEINVLTDNRTINLTNGKSSDILLEGIKPISTSSGAPGEREPIEVPETSDNVITALIMTIGSLFGFITTLIIKKKILN